VIDFEVPRAVLLQTVQLFSKARRTEPGDLIDLVCFNGAVRFVVLGRETTVEATVASRGSAQLPLSLLRKLGQMAATFDTQLIRVRVEQGRIRINSMAVANDAIRLERVLARPIDIPEDASDRDLLALVHLFTPEQVTDANLSSRVLAANSRKDKVLESASRDLAPYGVPGEEVKQLVQNALQFHAQSLRPILLPDPPPSGKPN
jgi:hypothetical protein